MLQYQLNVTWLSLKQYDFVMSNTEKQKKEVRNPSSTNLKRNILRHTYTRLKYFSFCHM